MIRVVIYLIILAALAYGGMLLLENPGHITITWYGQVINTSAALGIAAIALAAILLWVAVRLFFGLPSIMSYAAKRRRREKGYAAVSRGLIAVGSGDARAASRAAAQAGRHLKDDSLAIMLRAQAAHLAGDGRGAQMAFEELAEREDTRVLGLRGLYAEANRRGDDEAARHFAAAAHRASPLPWSAQAVLEHRATEQDWQTALATVESSVAAGLIDKATGERQRAVLETALAQDKEMSAPDDALRLARSAMKRAPDLAPPVVVAAQLLTRRGEIGKASRLIEKAWPRCQHPDIARAYLDVRPGDSTSDKLSRAKTLMGLSTFDPVARMTVGRAAIAAKDFSTARSAMEPLVGPGKRPTIQMCMLMAELEESEHGGGGLSREWQARASHASLDPAWVADGTVHDHWAPISPTTGRLDAFAWQVPIERMGRVMDAMPAREPTERALSSDPTLQIDHDGTAMIPPPAAPEPGPAVVTTKTVTASHQPVERDVTAEPNIAQPPLPVEPGQGEPMPAEPTPAEPIPATTRSNETKLFMRRTDAPPTLEPAVETKPFMRRMDVPPARAPAASSADGIIESAARPANSHDGAPAPAADGGAETPADAGSHADQRNAVIPSD